MSIVFGLLKYYSADLLLPSSLGIFSLFFLQNEYMKDNFLIKIETWHKPDTGHLENVISKDCDEPRRCMRVFERHEELFMIIFLGFRMTLNNARGKKVLILHR